MVGEFLCEIYRTFFDGLRLAFGHGFPNPLGVRPSANSNCLTNVRKYPSSTREVLCTDIRLGSASNNSQEEM